MILSNLFTAFLSIASVSASQSLGATNVDKINEPSKRGESLPRDGGFFNTGSVPSVSTNAGIYENLGCFEDGVRGKPLASPLLNLTGAPAETIQSCVNACSISGQNGIPYTYAGIEPGSCWCSNYILILSVRSSSFCLSSCPFNSGKYCGGTVNGIPYMQIYELKQGSRNVNLTSTTFSVESSRLMSQSGSMASRLTVSEPSTESFSSTATSPAPPVRNSKREYDITAPDSPWLPLLPLTSPQILKEVPPGQVPGWEQQAIAKEKKLESREYNTNAPDSPWRPLLPLHTPEFLKEAPSDQVPGWQGQPSTPLIPDSEVPLKPKSKAKPKAKLHRRQLGPIPENFLEPPGRPDFIKEFPEKNNNKPRPPFDRLKDFIDPATGKKIPPKKPKYSHSKISLRKRPSLKDIGLLSDGRVGVSVDKTKNPNDNEEEMKRKAEWKKINEKKFANKLHLQGSPKAYAEMEEKMAMRRRKGQVKDVMEEWEKRIFMGLGRGKGGEGDENENGEEGVADPVAREDAIINRVLLGEGDWDEGDEDDREEGGEGEDGWMWRKWGGKKWSGGKREGRKIHLEKK